MRVRSLAFAGYRSFAARSPAAPDRPLQRLQLAPLTILLGKNNSGKSTTARLLHHTLLALGDDKKDPFPMSSPRETYGESFRDVQHGGFFLNSLDLEVELSSDDGEETTFAAQLRKAGDSTEDRVPRVQMCRLGGKDIAVDRLPIKGLLPDIKEARAWREGARELLEASCHLGPIRDSAKSSYKVNQGGQDAGLPVGHEAVAQLLLADSELRAAVGDWMAQHLEGWRVDTQQILEVFNLVTRRGSRLSNLAAAGQGIQQVLPVAVLCCMRSLSRGSGPFLDIIEQPELHLHDAAHAPLGDLLLSATFVQSGDVMIPRGGTLVVETHSESLVLRIRRRVAERRLTPDQVSLVYVDDTGEGSTLRNIPMLPDGEIEWWPEGVFSEAFVELKAIRRAQRAHGGA